jgi:hypothetical protein
VFDSSSRVPAVQAERMEGRVKLVASGSQAQSVR